MTITKTNNRGGYREGAGRKPSPWRTSEYARKVLEWSQNDPSGKRPSPLQFLIKVMQDESVAFDIRWKSAVAAAPYCHAKLQSIEVRDPDASRMTVVIRDFSDKQAIISSTLAPALPLATSNAAAMAQVIDDDTESDLDESGEC